MRCLTLNLVLRGFARRLRGSKEIAIRATRPDDRERLVKAFHGLDRRSIYQRFFFAKRELSDDELRQITECDREREVVLVATVDSGNDEVIVGLGQYSRRGAIAQIAFAVAEDFRGRGLAIRLLRHLIRIARDNGVSHFVADVLADNRRMLEVLRHSGLPMEEHEADGIVHMTLLLEAIPGIDRAPLCHSIQTEQRPFSHHSQAACDYRDSSNRVAVKLR